MTVQSLCAFVMVLLIWRDPARLALNRIMGIGSGTNEGPSATIKVLALLIVIALVLVIDPEIRLLLLFVDAVGVDFFLLLLAIQGRELFSLLNGTVIFPAAHYLATLGPYPLPLPSRWFFAQHPFWAAYAVAQFVAVASVIACLVAGAVAAGASAATASIGKGLTGALFAAFRRTEWVPIPRISRTACHIPRAITLGCG
jgi:hypothetical protein